MLRFIYERKTFTVVDGKDGVKKAKELLPDLVLMDVRMPPDPNAGIDAALTLKEMPEIKSIKIAFLNSLENSWLNISGERWVISREFGMEDFIPKTEDLGKFLDKVKEIFAR